MNNKSQSCGNLLTNKFTQVSNTSFEKVSFSLWKPRHLLNYAADRQKQKNVIAADNETRLIALGWPSLFGQKLYKKRESL